MTIRYYRSIHIALRKHYRIGRRAWLLEIWNFLIWDGQKTSPTLAKFRDALQKSEENPIAIHQEVESLSNRFAPKMEKWILK